jgi:hypothetical protein
MQTLPTDIHLGMKVLDRTQKEIGKVDDFRFSENEESPNVQPADIDASDRYRDKTLVDNIAEVLGAEQLPESLRDRLLREGYIRLDTAGLFAADRYILPQQINSTSGDAVVLNVTKDELLKLH